MKNSKKLQVRIDEYAYGVWFDTVDIDPYSQTVRIYDHLFNKEQTFSDLENKMLYREVEVTE
jgi:hypothetical protein